MLKIGNIGPNIITKSKGPFGTKDVFKYKTMVRYFSCDTYAACLQVACEEKWKAWTCEGCCHITTNKEDLFTVEAVKHY